MDTIANQTTPQTTTLPVTLPPFFQFVFRNKTNKRYLLLALIGGFIEMAILKVLYPYPDFISDSYSYIETNLNHMDVNLWPIGYSKFLWLIHAITPSQVFLAFTQYFILAIAMLYFFFSIHYLYGLKKSHSTILFIFLFFNPFFLYLSNCVLSDTLFLAITLVWFTQYMWMYHQPRLQHIIIQAVLIGLAFTIRYTAIYYPIVAAIAFLLSRQRIVYKIAGILSPWLLIIPFILYTQQKTKEVTGTAEFSVFGGWQIANNALYMYGHIQVDSTQLPASTRELDRLTKKFFQVMPPTEEELKEMPGTYFMKVPWAILKPYMNKRYIYHNAPSSFWAWGQVSPIYNAYGKYLITHYPFSFARYYLWLNTKNYFIPHLEKFGYYNFGEDSVWQTAQIWFQLKSSKANAAPVSKVQGLFYFLYPPLFMMLNLYFLGSFLVLLFRSKTKSFHPVLYPALLLTVAFLLINFGFSIFATPVVMRYQAFPMILLVCFSLFLTTAMDKTDRVKNLKTAI